MMMVGNSQCLQEILRFLRMIRRAKLLCGIVDLLDECIAGVTPLRLNKRNFLLKGFELSDNLYDDTALFMGTDFV